MHAARNATPRGATMADHLRAFAGLFGGGKRPVKWREQRWAPRSPLFRAATVRGSGGVMRQVALKNLSATGARVEFYAREPLPDDLLLIEPIRGLRRRARVVWQDDFTAGLEFTDG